MFDLVFCGNLLQATNYLLSLQHLLFLQEPIFDLVAFGTRPQAEDYHPFLSHLHAHQVPKLYLASL